MEDKLIRYFSRFARFTDEERHALAESMDIRSIPKGRLLVREGQYHTDTYFILDGLVRRYRINDGLELTTDFYTEAQWIISLNSFAADTHSDDNLICEEDTVLVTGNEQKAQELFRRFPRFETISRAVMETVFAARQKAMNHYLADTPEQRYLRLLENNPGIIQRVPQYHIASYLGVKPESLSRIRKRIASRVQGGDNPDPRLS